MRKKLKIFTIVSLLLIIQIHSSITEVTSFFNQQSNKTLLYQVYTGYEDPDWYYPKVSASIFYSLWQGYALSWEDKSIPLIIWLQGGPGAPSQFGCFNEVGPLLIKGENGNFKVTENQWGWNYFGHLMCVDQPVGVGFSYNNNTKKVNNTRDAAKQLINFLSNFFKNNPQLALGKNPLYLAGQSYAGHFIPAIAEMMLSNSSLGFNLKGVMLGGGFVDPIYQVNNYDSFLNSIGIVSNEWKKTTAFMQNEAIVNIMRTNLSEAFGYINFIVTNEQVINNRYGGVNVQNYKQYDDGNINPSYKMYLQSNKKKFGVPDWVNYVEDNQQMYADFSQDFSLSFRNSLEYVLSSNIQTLIYNGQNDFIVNTPGVISYLNALQWEYLKQWKETPKKTWLQFGEQNIGWFKRYRNLNLVVIRKAGNLLPADQPKVAWTMLNNYFLNGW